MDEGNRAVLAMVSLALNDLTREEMLALLVAVQLGSDPRGRLGYRKVAYLWDQDGVTMHDLTRRYFVDLASKRVREQ